MEQTSDNQKRQKVLLMTRQFFDKYFEQTEFNNNFDYSESFAISFFDVVSSYNTKKNQKFAKSLIKNINFLLKLKPNFLRHNNFDPVKGDKNKYLYEIHYSNEPDPYRVAFAVSEDRLRIVFLYIFLENKITWKRVLKDKLPSKQEHEEELGYSFQMRR